MDAQETRIYTAIIITSIVLGIIIGYFIVSIIRQQRRNARLNKQIILSEITGLENERRRIATDLHDELGPILSAVKLKMNSLDFQNAEQQEEMEIMTNPIDDVIKRMREISFDLMPTSLTRKGLINTIEEFVNNLNADSAIKFVLNVSPEKNEFDGFTVDKIINLYRIIQEIIHNIIKHSKASSAAINIRKDVKEVFITISDDGIGFDYKKKLEENNGMGLRSLLNRTEIMNGKMFLESMPGKGTVYTFQIPL